MTKFSEICSRAIDIVIQTGAFIKQEAESFSISDVEEKSRNSFVTYVDKKAEEMLIESLGALIPQAGFIAEEEGSRKPDADYVWVVDPLDGTTNYIHRVPVFSISVALLYKNTPVVGVIYEIMRGECFHAVKGGGAFMNGIPIQVSKTTQMGSCLMATGFPYYDYSRLESYMQLLSWCMRNTHGLRRMGSAAVDLAYVACGRFDGFFEYGLNAWDVAAGILLVREAGGVAEDFKGLGNPVFGKEIVAANKAVYSAFAPVIKEHLNS